MHLRDDLIYDLLNRKSSLFGSDVERNEGLLAEIIQGSRFLVIGGAGSIGRAVVKEIFKRKAKLLHVVDLSENNLVELVRSLRSEYAYMTDDFDTFAIDCGADYFADFLVNGQYDYIINLSAMKHVRSENSIHSIYRMIATNIINPYKHCQTLNHLSTGKYFCVSSDKAANPANIMGATKRAMEYALFGTSFNFPISMARFANVAFSDGSLLDGFRYRIDGGHPITIPEDISRFFISSEEAGQICLLSTIFSEDQQIAIPNHTASLNLTSFQSLLEKFLLQRGLKPYFCESEDEARAYFLTNQKTNYWPVYKFASDTTGEKKYEEFHTTREIIVPSQFTNIDYVKFKSDIREVSVSDFMRILTEKKKLENLDKASIITLLSNFLHGFEHVEKNKYLNQRM